MGVEQDHSPIASGVSSSAGSPSLARSPRADPLQRPKGKRRPGFATGTHSITGSPLRQMVTRSTAATSFENCVSA